MLWIPYPHCKGEGVGHSYLPLEASTGKYILLWELGKGIPLPQVYSVHQEGQAVPGPGKGSSTGSPEEMTCVSYSRRTWETHLSFPWEVERASSRVADGLWIKDRKFSVPQSLLDQRKQPSGYLKSMPRGITQRDLRIKRMEVKCQIPRCRKRRYKPWARKEMYLLWSRNCRGKYPSDGSTFLNNPTQGRKSQYQKLSGHKPASNSRGEWALSSHFLPWLPWSSSYSPLLLRSGSVRNGG